MDNDNKTPNRRPVRRSIKPVTPETEHRESGQEAAGEERARTQATSRATGRRINVQRRVMDGEPEQERPTAAQQSAAERRARRQAERERQQTEPKERTMRPSVSRKRTEDAPEQQPKRAPVRRKRTPADETVGQGAPGAQAMEGKPAIARPAPVKRRQQVAEQQKAPMIAPAQPVDDAYQAPSEPQDSSDAIREVPLVADTRAQLQDAIDAVDSRGEQMDRLREEKEPAGKQTVYKTERMERMPREARAEAMTVEEAEEKRSLIKTLTRPLISVAIGLVVIVVLGFATYKYALKHYFSPVNKNDTDKYPFTITEQDNTLAKIAQKLQEEGFIRSSTIFKYYVDFTDMSTKIGKGSYMLSPSMTMDEIIQEIKRSTGESQAGTVLLREGILIDETNIGMAQILVKNGIVASEDLFKNQTDILTDELVRKYPFLKSAKEAQDKSPEKRTYALEGYLFPDTYSFFYNSDPDDVIDRMLSRFGEVFTEEYAARAEELGMSIDEVVTLASIIEKEAKTDDFTKVSAVFHNRMNSNETNGLLQSCATHQYFMETKKFVYTTEETKIPSPYNTYINTGLPIGPISNPGKAAIEAALYPESSYLNTYYYFCLGDGATGETVFAKTYEEHQQNVATYSPTWDQD